MVSPLGHLSRRSVVDGRRWRRRGLWTVLTVALFPKKLCLQLVLLLAHYRCPLVPAFTHCYPNAGTLPVVWTCHGFYLHAHDLGRWLCLPGFID